MQMEEITKGCCHRHRMCFQVRGDRSLFLSFFLHFFREREREREKEGEKERKRERVYN